MDPTNVTTEVEPALPLVRRRLGFFKKHQRWWWAGAAVVVAALIFVSRDGGQEVRYVTQPLTRGPLTITITATGTLQPTNQVQVGSELSGTIRAVNVNFNDTVKAGQVMASLDTSRLKAQVLQSESSLASAKARVIEARASVTESRANLSRLERVRELSNNKLPSQQDMDVAKSAFARAEAEVQAAEAATAQAAATLDAARTDLRKADIKSPIDGVVLVRSIEPGQTVAASLQAPVLFTLAEDLRRMELHVAVDEADVGKVNVGQSANFTVDAFPDQRFDARITAVRYAPTTQNSGSSSSSTASATSTGVVTYETVLVVDNSRLLLRPGMTATAEIVVQSIPETLLVPNAALRFSPPQDKSKSAGRDEAKQNKGFMSALMPQQRPRARAKRGQRAAQVWVLQDEQPTAMKLRTGASDGRMTQVLGGDAKEGTEVIVDSETGKP